MTTVGYVWVGPLEHNADYQRALLRERGAERLFEDVSAHTSTQMREHLTDALDELHAGDTLLVWRLDRLGATTSAVVSLLDLLGRRQVGVVSVADKLDTTGPDGAALLRFVAAFTDLDRRLHRERTIVGVYAARSRGRVGGRPRALSSTNVERVLMLRDQGATVREIAEALGTSRATVYRVIQDADRGAAEAQDDDPAPAPAPAPPQRRTRTLRLPSIEHDAGSLPATD